MSKSNDPFHVMGNDNVIRALAEHYDGKKDVEQDPYGAWLAIQNQANRIEELEAAIKRQASASKTLRSFDLERTQHLEAIDRSEYTAAKTLDSERQANAILTDRIEELEAKLAKAVEALDVIAGRNDYADDPWGIDTTNNLLFAILFYMWGRDG